METKVPLTGERTSPSVESIDSFFPANRSESDSTSVTDETPPQFFPSIDSFFPANKSESDSTSVTDETPPQFCTSIYSIFPANKSESDSISVTDETPPQFCTSIYSIFPANKSESDSTSESDERRSQFCTSIDSIFLANKSEYDSISVSDEGRSQFCLSIHSIFQPTISEYDSTSVSDDERFPQLCPSIFPPRKKKVPRLSIIRRLGSRIMGRQRSGTSSKHTARAEEFLPEEFSLSELAAASNTARAVEFSLSELAAASNTAWAEEFSLSELAAASNNFSLENKLGAGSFGVVYRCKLMDGRDVAIKRGETASKTKKFQMKEIAFDSELAFLSRLHHKHLVRLVGYCEEKGERLLVYEYMKNGALYDHLHDRNYVENSISVLNSWKMRIKITLDAARGIEYLHNYAVPPIIHSDIKTSNILLDANWTARVSDLGLSLLDYRPTKACGTVGYIDPEYYGLKALTAKSDVYGLGVVLLELLTGKRAIFRNGENGGTSVSVVDFAVPAIMAGELVKVLDSRVGPPVMNESESVELVTYTAMHCVNLEGKKRPTMADIVANLDRALALCDDSHGSISSGSITIVSE